MMTNMIGTTSANAAMPDEGRHLGEDLFGAVGRGRDAVRRQDAEGDRAIESFAAQLLGDERLSEEESLDRGSPTTRGRRQPSWRGTSEAATFWKSRLSASDTHSILNEAFTRLW